jgi:hypothetical protein
MKKALQRGKEILASLATRLPNVFFRKKLPSFWEEKPFSGSVAKTPSS